MRQKKSERIVEERTARLRALRLAREASWKLDREVSKKAASPRAKEHSNRETAASIPVNELNAANDK